MPPTGETKSQQTLARAAQVVGGTRELTETSMSAAKQEWGLMLTTLQDPEGVDPPTVWLSLGTAVTGVGMTVELGPVGSPFSPMCLIVVGSAPCPDSRMPASASGKLGEKVTWAGRHSRVWAQPGLPSAMTGPDEGCRAGIF